MYTKDVPAVVPAVNEHLWLVKKVTRNLTGEVCLLITFSLCNDTFHKFVYCMNQLGKLLGAELNIAKLILALSGQRPAH